MSFWTNAFLSIGTLLVPAFIAAWRIKKISQAFLPFILLIWCGLCSEAMGLWQVTHNHSNLVVYNVFGLVEPVLVVWQFRRWGLWMISRGRQWLYPLLTLIFLACWVWESFLLEPGIGFSNSYFTAFYSLVIVILSIDMLARQLVFYFDRLYRDPVFLICLGFAVYFLVSFITELFWVYGLTISSAFRLRVYTVVCYINLFVNVIYAFALLWVPMKFRYSRLWSSLG